MLRAIAIWVSEREIILLSFTGQWCFSEKREIDYQHYCVFTYGPVWRPLCRPACLSSISALTCVCFPTLHCHHKSWLMLSASQDRYSCFCYRSITQDLTDLPLVISFGEFRQILIGVNRKLPLLNSKSNIVLYAAKMHSLNIHIQMLHTCYRYFLLW